jgi:thioredoxin 1
MNKSTIININNNDILDNFIKNHNKIIIKLYATWCKPCKKITPFYEIYSKEYNNILFCEINIEEFDNIINIYDIKKFPTFIFINNNIIFSKLESSDEKILKIEIDRFNDDINLNDCINSEDF